MPLVFISHQLLVPQVGKFEEGRICILNHLAQRRLYLIKTCEFGENSLFKFTKLAKQGHSARTWQISLHWIGVNPLKQSTYKA